jgi:hypothetical protein
MGSSQPPSSDTVLLSVTHVILCSENTPLYVPTPTGLWVGDGSSSGSFNQIAVALVMGLRQCGLEWKIAAGKNYGTRSV